MKFDRLDFVKLGDPPEIRTTNPFETLEYITYCKDTDSVIIIGDKCGKEGQCLWLDARFFIWSVEAHKGDGHIQFGDDFFIDPFYARYFLYNMMGYKRNE